MVFIHKKEVGGQTYYTLRMTVRKNGKVIAKDLCSLGTDLSRININSLEKTHKKEIRKSYKTIKRFLESNKYFERAKAKKLKKSSQLSTEQQNKIESTRLHYKEKFQKLPKLSRKDILEQFLLRFAVNSTSIEGNTITLKEAARLFSEDIIPKNRTTREVFDLTNTRKVFFSLLENREPITAGLLEKVHDRLLENIDERKGFRNHDIHIYGQPFKPTPTRYLKEDIQSLIDWYEKHKKTLHPLSLATLFHHKFENIHPFSDGNGRTGRMIMNHILMLNNYPPVVVNRLERKEYLTAMNQADKAVTKDLQSTSNEHYDKLLDFMTTQLEQSYWDIFLC